MKAGLLEIADIIVVNKGDREGCDRLIMDLKFAFELRDKQAGWHFPILKTIATENKGIEELVSVIASHREYLYKSGKLEDERKEKLMLRIHELIEEKIRTHLKEKIIKEDELKAMVDKVYKRKLNPYRIAGKIAKGIIKSQTKWK